MQFFSLKVQRYLTRLPRYNRLRPKPFAFTPPLDFVFANSNASGSVFLNTTSLRQMVRDFSCFLSNYFAIVATFPPEADPPLAGALLTLLPRYNIAHNKRSPSALAHTRFQIHWGSVCCRGNVKRCFSIFLLRILCRHSGIFGARAVKDCEVSISDSVGSLDTNEVLKGSSDGKIEVPAELF